MEALIVYDGTNDTNRKFAHAIAHKIQKRFDSIKIQDIPETSHADVENCDVLYLGSGVKGMVFVDKKPEKIWADFVSALPAFEGKKTVLFTTYKFSARGMFRSMKALLIPKKFKVIGSMKSRLGTINYNSFSVLRYSVSC
jgi:menaquinone-dependent protoporphyrinogen IX oxidase